MQNNDEFNDIFLISNLLNPSLENAIDEISEDDIGRTNKVLTFSTHTPLVFQTLGIKDLPIEMYVDKLARGLFLTNSEMHGHRDSINKELVKKVAKELGNPVAIFNSSTVKNSIVALYSLYDQKGNPIMLSISLGREKNNRLIVNLITSIYGRTSDVGYIKWVNQGLLKYYDDKKIKELSVRLQLPSASILYTNKVLTKSDIVNKLRNHCRSNYEKNNNPRRKR